MIRPLRQRHRFIVFALALFLPLAFVLALSARKTPPRMRELPRALSNEASSFPRVLWMNENLWPDRNLTTRVCGDSIPPSRLALELHPREDFNAPDILVYWSPQNSGEDLNDAYLLGTLAGKHKRSWPLPEAALQTEGQIVLYSLGHQQILERAVLPLRKILEGGQWQ
ncbi:MAG: hypothetical protein AAB354_14630 [candidate division KSB1 bacterium]